MKRTLLLAAALAALATTLQAGNHATWLRRAFAETGTLTDVVRRQSTLWMAAD